MTIRDDIVARLSGVPAGLTDGEIATGLGNSGSVYARGPKAGQAEPTAPTLQAKHWLSEAVVKTLRTHEKYPKAIAAVGFPDMLRYRSPLTDVSASLAILIVTVFLVQIDGSVTTWKGA